MLGASVGITSLAAAGAAFACALALGPVAIRLATAAGHLDRPSGWKRHEGAVPYLGGASILAAAAVAAAAVSDIDVPWELVAATLGLALVGMLDDQRQLHAWPRLLAEAGAAVLVWEAGLGWDYGGNATELVLTVVWVLAVVNAINLIDLMDGVAASCIAAGATGAAVLAALEGMDGLAAGTAAGVGACLGFLRLNLARPARIFLGDGGTMPLGLLLAVACARSVGSATPGAGLPAAALLVGVPLADMAMRIAIRVRRGDSVMTPGPDSIANRIRDRVGSAQRTCAVLAGAQLCLAAVAVGLVRAT